MAAGAMAGCGRPTLRQPRPIPHSLVGAPPSTQFPAWRCVTAEFHAHGGILLGQLRHGGRARRVSHQPNGSTPAGFTHTGAKNAISMVFGADGNPAFLVQRKPRALRTQDVPVTVGELARAAQCHCSGLGGIESTRPTLPP